MNGVISWEHIGVVIGGILAGLVAGLVWLARLQNNRQTAEHGTVIRRDEFTQTLTELRVRLEDAAMDAREARAAASAAQTSVASIGQLIESSMRSLGDRLEGALRDMKDRVDAHDDRLNDHYGRLRSVETELKLKRDE